jgi:NTE family protein
VADQRSPISRTVGLALSGGGARGFAHVGVLRALVGNGIPIDVVAGTSAGSMVGGAYAAGMPVGDIEAMAARVRWTNMIRPSLSPLGLFSTVPMGRFLEHELPIRQIEEMPIPFAAVACDHATGEELIIDQGDAVLAIRASCSVPGVFAPVIDKQGRMLVDGGVVSPTPVDAARALGADVVIAVDLLACGSTFRSRPRSAFGMMLGSAMRLLTVASRAQQRTADLTIIPKIGHLRPDQIGKRDEFISLGEAAVSERLDDLSKLMAGI